jgi:hypothetical protein
MVSHRRRGRHLRRRVISATDIQEMADTFDPRVYGCRINLEHLRGILPDGRSAVMAMWSS